MLDSQGTFRGREIQRHSNGREQNACQNSAGWRGNSGATWRMRTALLSGGTCCSWGWQGSRPMGDLDLSSRPSVGGGEPILTYTSLKPAEGGQGTPQARCLGRWRTQHLECRDEGCRRRCAPERDWRRQGKRFSMIVRFAMAFHTPNCL